jgi:hypothetical protein
MVFSRSNTIKIASKEVLFVVTKALLWHALTDWLDQVIFGNKFAPGAG